MYRIGLLQVMAAALFTSTAGILIRLVEAADGWQILFYRSLSLVIFLLLVLWWRHGAALPSKFLALGRAGCIVAACLGTALVCFILALIETTVANVVFIVSASPFFAAIFAWLTMREPISGRLWIAMAAAFVGIALMVGESLGAGTLAGSLLAMTACVCYAMTVVGFRRGRDIDYLPAVCLAGLFAMAVAATQIESFAISPHDLTIAVTLGVVQLGIQYILVVAGSRHVSAAEITLVGRIGTVLGPLWVWFGVGEEPGRMTLIGGAIVLGAVLINSITGLAKQRRG